MSVEAEITSLQKHVKDLLAIEMPVGGGGGIGDMLKSTYDTDGDGTVNSAEYADTAGSAASATNADYATTAGSATTAGDSDKLDGVHASAFAPAAKGVTNGDSHDHDGGDGAQINHTKLSNIGTNTHAQIDTHLGSTSNPHGVTAAQIGAATELASGCVELATIAEVKAGTDTARAVTPAGIASVVKLNTPASDGGVVKAGPGVVTVSADGNYTVTIPASITTLGRTANVAAGKVLFGSNVNNADATAEFHFDGTNLSIGNHAPSALLDVGNHSGVDPLNASILINTQRAVASNARGFVDGTVFAPTGAGYAYACYDIRLRTGGASNMDHVIGVQGDIRHEVAVTLSKLYTVGSMPQVNAGTVTILYHYYVKEVSGAGSVGTQYGLYMNELVKGTTNWAVYAAGKTKSRIGGQIGVGEDPSNYTGHFVRTSAVSTGDVGGIKNNVTSNATSGYGQTVYGEYAIVEIADGASYGATALYGGRFYASNRGDQTLANAYGIYSQIYHRAAGTLTNAYGVYAASYSIEGTLTNAYGVYSDVGKTSGTVTNAYGIYVKDVKAGGTLNYAIYTGAGVVRFGGDLQHAGSKAGFYNKTAVAQPAVPTYTAIQTTQTAGASYTSNEQTMLANLKTDVTNLRAAIVALTNKFDQSAAAVGLLSGTAA